MTTRLAEHADADHAGADHADDDADDMEGPFERFGGLRRLRGLKALLDSNFDNMFLNLFPSSLRLAVFHFQELVKSSGAVIWPDL